MSQKQLIIGVVAVIVIAVGVWFVWQRRGISSEEKALQTEVEAEVQAMGADFADLEASLSQ